MGIKALPLLKQVAAGVLTLYGDGTHKLEPLVAKG